MFSWARVGGWSGLVWSGCKMVPSYPTLAALACSQLRRSLPTSSNGLRSHRLHTGWFIFRSGRCWWPSSSSGGGVGGQVQQQSCECQGHRPTGAQHCAHKRSPTTTTTTTDDDKKLTIPKNAQRLHVFFLTADLRSRHTELSSHHICVHE